MKCAVHVSDRDKHTSVYFVWLGGSRCLLLTWCAIQGILSLFLIRTQKTSIIEETNSGNGLNQQKKRPDWWYRHCDCLILCAPNPAVFLQRISKTGTKEKAPTRNKHQKKQLNWWQRPCDSLIPCPKHPTAWLTWNVHNPYGWGDRGSNTSVCSTKKKQLKWW
jgi:hypothetical protein